MGRPLNKRNFKDADGISVYFNDGTSSFTTGWILKQLGSKRFRCVEAGETDTSVYTDCVLVSSATPGEGEMSIVLEADLYVTKISGRKLTASDGNTYTWNITTGAVDNKSGGYFNLDND